MTTIQNAKSRMTKLIAAAVSASILILYGIAGITTVEPGEVALKIGMLGPAKGTITTLSLGMTWVDPIRYDVATYDTRAQQYIIEDVPANTNDGQPITVDLSLEISLADDGVPRLHDEIGRDWYERVVYPASREAIRDGAAGQNSDAIYTGEGRQLVSQFVQSTLRAHVEDRGILITVNLRDVEFLNPDFVRTLERKAQAAQEETIQERLAAAARQEALKTQAEAEGQRFRVEQEAQAQRFRVEQEAEARREQLRLEGEGLRLAEEERAQGILAVATAEAEGIRLKNEALSGPGGALVRDIEVLAGLGKNVEFYGVPTGAEGTSTYIIDEALRGQIAVGN